MTELSTKVLHKTHLFVLSGWNHFFYLKGKILLNFKMNINGSMLNADVSMLNAVVSIETTLGTYQFSLDYTFKEINVFKGGPTSVLPKCAN
jgi:hypothetical protein